MRIGLYNLEPKYTNLAIEKLRFYYQCEGAVVEDYLPINEGKYDKVYASSIFDFTPKDYVTADMVCGGSGFDLTTELPPEVEEMKPKLNFGFTTRGCFRECPFCIVPRKEGKLRVVGDIYDFWDGKSKAIRILDNNILGNRKHFEMICTQLSTHNLKVDFTQGLDAGGKTPRKA